MTKRLRILLAVLGSIVVIAVLLYPLRFWALGTIRGEHFYAGWPTCYWSHETYAYLTDDSTPKPAVLSGKPETTLVLLDLANDPSNLVRVEAVESLLWANPDDEEIRRQAIYSLIGALKAPGVKGRCLAADTLRRIGPAAKEAIPALLQAGKEGPDGVYIATSYALQAIDPDSEAKK
jgi:hypothetical protein